MPQTKRGLNDGSQGGLAVPTGSISQKKHKGESHLDEGGPSRAHKKTLYCPVPSCPRSNTSSNGWKSMFSLRRHLKEHQGRLPDAIPTEFLDYHNLKSCPICGYIIAQSLNSCRKCAPAHRAAASTSRSDTPATDVYCLRMRFVRHGCASSNTYRNEQELSGVRSSPRPLLMRCTTTRPRPGLSC